MEEKKEVSQDILTSDIETGNITTKELCNNLCTNDKKNSIDNDQIMGIYDAKRAKKMDFYSTDNNEKYPIMCDSWGDPCSYKLAKEEGINYRLLIKLLDSTYPINTEASGYETIWLNDIDEVASYLFSKIEEGDALICSFTDQYVVTDKSKFLSHLKNNLKSCSGISSIVRYGDDRGLTYLDKNPYISISKTDKINQILDEYGFETQPFGRSGFANRRSIAYITKNEPIARTCYYISGGWGKEGYHKPTRIVKSFVWDFDKSDVKKAIEESKIELNHQRHKESEKRIITGSKDGKISAVKYGYDVPMPDHPDWEEIWSVRTGCCADHRRNLTHEYLGIFLHKGSKGKVIVEIPDEYKGMFIGKKGANIKSLQEKHNIKIVLK